MNKKQYPLLALLLFLTFPLFAQDDLLNMLEENEEPRTDYATATFKGTRVITGQSVETPAGGVLQFMILHRFGRVNGGAYELFGLDNATIRIGLDYGITDRLAVGIGRSSFEKTYDGNLKYKLLRQSSGKRTMPVSVTAFSSVAYKSVAWEDPNRQNLLASRLFYTHQLLIARKFTESLSLQLTPTLVHRNLVETSADKNDVLALGLSGRQKLTPSISVNAEYFFVLPGQIVSPLYGEKVRNTLALGVDIETGGHVFQLHLSNSRGMIEKFFVTETTGSWLAGDIHLGFNISRVFTIVDPLKKYK